MSILRNIFDFLLGNGTVNLQQHETEMQDRKAQIRKCNGETVLNFQQAGKVFDEIEIEDLPEEIPFDFEQGGSHGRG